MNKAVKALIDIDRRFKTTQHIGALLGWDQETYMPHAASDERSDQLALVEGLVHERITAPATGELLESLGVSDANPGGDPALDPAERAYLRALYREYSQRVKLPRDLVEEVAKTCSLAQGAWVDARSKDDFPAFAPHLERVIALNRRVASCLDPSRKPYDVLLDRFEPGSDEASISPVFAALRADLVTLLGKIASRPQVDDSFLNRKCPEPLQRAVSEYFMDALGYDRERGRLDKTAHPFSTTLGESDMRITTRFEEGFWPSGAFSTLHETGHALYEQGIDPGPEYRRTSLSEASSMAIHESQSRFWENMVGRGDGFWKRHYPKISSLLGPALAGVPLESFRKAINKVEPSLIRVEADEVTYSLHVILRFELESEFMAGRLSVRDIPAAWRERMKDLLGLAPRNDREGCLQDVHWSAGLVGYFPSYALGNLYGAQFYDTMKKDLPGIEGAPERGEQARMLAWLRDKVHKGGASLLPSELCERVTGKKLDASHFIGYLNAKYSEVYGF